MFFILLVLAAVAVFLYGLYVIAVGKLAIGNQETLTGSPARWVGVCYLLPIPASILALQIHAHYLLSIGVSMEEIESVATYNIQRLIIEALIFLAIMFFSVKLGKYFYANKKSDESEK